MANEEKENKEKVVNENLMQSYLFKDTIFGTDAYASVGGPKAIDQSSVRDYISQIERPTGTDPLSKQAAYYRQKGEADVLRTQMNAEAFFMPAINLYKEREEAANIAFQIYQKTMPEFDDSIIFGKQSGVEIPIVDEIKNISTTVKEDLRLLSRLNINDPRYDELRKKVEANQDIILQFDKINQKLLAIRNDIGTNEDGSEIKLGNNNEKDWSGTIPPEERRMWMDIYNGKGENIKIIDGKLTWIDPEGGQILDPAKISEFDKGSGFDKLQIINNPDINNLNQILYPNIGHSDHKEKIDDGTFNPDEEFTTEIQQNLVNLGYDLGNTGPKGNGVDGDYGSKTKKALNLYIKHYGEAGYGNVGFESYNMETGNVLDPTKIGKDNKIQQLIEDYKKSEYTITDPNYSPETNPESFIDLSTIGDGPRMKDGIAFRGHLNIVDAVYKSRAAGADPNGDGNQRNLFTMTMVNVEDSFDALDIDGQASLLFDGIDRVGKDAEALDVNTFLNNILSENVDGWENMSEDERGRFIGEMKTKGMLGMYTLNGEEKTLAQHFKNFYLEEMKTLASDYTIPKSSSNINTSSNRPKSLYKPPSKTDLGIGGGDGKTGDYNIFPGGYQTDSQSRSMSGDVLEKIYASFKNGNDIPSGSGGSWQHVYDGDNVYWVDSQTKEIMSATEMMQMISESLGEKGFNLLSLPAFDEFMGDYKPEVEEKEEPVNHIDYIVDNIWNTDSGTQPENFTEYLFSQFGNKFDSVRKITSDDNNFRVQPDSYGQNDISIIGVGGGDNHFLVQTFDNRITIRKWVSDTSVKYGDDMGYWDEIDHWKPNSWGGRGYDKEDVEEMFKALGL